MKKILFISSGGGHLEELLQLKEIFSLCDYKIVSEKTDTTVTLLKNYKNVSFLKYGTRYHLLSYFFIFIYNCIKSYFIYLSFKPDYVITTGTHTAVPMCYIAHKHGKKVVFIETFANINTSTESGKIVYKYADKFIVQWPSMLEHYKKAECWGSIF